MVLFNRLKKQTPLEMTTMDDGLVVPAQLAAYWSHVKAAGLPSLVISTQPGVAALDGNKFGHVPCLPQGYDYPKDDAGEYLFPLAQFNFAQMPALPGFPGEGLLQFYISMDNDLDHFDEEPTAPSIKVLYFEPKEMATSAWSPEHLFTDASRPIKTPQLLSFTLQTDYMGIGDSLTNPHHFDAEAFAAHHPAEKAQLLEFIHENLVRSGHKLGGYASFMSEDPRRHEPLLEGYVPLLQIRVDKEHDDEGMHRFFIHPQQLAARDFSKVVYYPDTW